MRNHDVKVLSDSVVDDFGKILALLIREKQPTIDRGHDAINDRFPFEQTTFGLGISIGFPL